MEKNPSSIKAIKKARRAIRNRESLRFQPIKDMVDIIKRSVR